MVNTGRAHEDRHIGMSEPVACKLCGVEGRPGAMFCAACGGELIAAPASGRTGTVIAPAPDLSTPPPAAPASAPPAAPEPPSVESTAVRAPVASSAVPAAPMEGARSGSSPAAAQSGLGRMHWSAFATVAGLAVVTVGALLLLVGAILSEEALSVILEEQRIGMIVASDDAIAQANRADAIYSAGWLVTWIALIVTPILFVIWLYGAYGRVAANGFGDAERRRPRHQTIWSWVVPIFNLFRPVQLVADLDRMSRGPLANGESDPWKRPVGAAIVVWWILWLIGGFAVNAASTVADTIATSDIDELTNSYYALAFFVLFYGAAAVAAILVVLRIARTPVQRGIRRG
jgi:hypothetical protein